MACDSSIFRPINSFIKYFGDIKPYHTKILEVVEQYVFREEISVLIGETPSFEVILSNNPLCKGVGFGLDFDDACGFDALECCDLFECIGGFGLVFDNSDQLVESPVNSIDGTTGQIRIPGNYLYDTFINIKSIPNLGEIRLDGDQSYFFNNHTMFWVVRKNNLPMNSILTPITFTLMGNYVDDLLAKVNFEILNAGLNDGHYGVVNAIYSTSTGLTTVTTNRPIPDTILGTILFESNNKNNGVYQVESFNVVSGETRIILEPETQARFMDTEISDEEGHGAIQLRTGFIPNRKIWIEDDNTPNPYPPNPDIPDNGSPFPNNGEWKITQAWYDATSGETVVVVDGTMLSSTNPSTVIKLYGYETGGGFDGLNECSEPQPFNINTAISEYVVIQVIDIPLPSASPVPPSITPTLTPTITPTLSITPSSGPTPTITPTLTVTPSSGPILPQPLHHWAFEGNTLDSIGNNDGTIVDDTGLNSVTLTTFDSKGVVYFRKNSYAGTNYFATTSINLDSPLTDNIMSLEGWIYATEDSYAFTNVGEYAISLLTDSNDTRPFTIFVPTTGPAYAYNNIPRAAIVSKWSHVVMTYNRNTGFAKCYVDSVLIYDISIGIYPPLNLSKIGTIGSSNNYATASYISDIKYYNIELTDSDVIALYTSSNSSYTPNNPPQPTITPTPTPSPVPMITDMNWTLRNASDNSVGWQGVAWSPELGLFAAVGSGKVMTSPDGVNWTDQATFSYVYNAIAWSPEFGLFAAVGTAGPPIISFDGITWTSQIETSGNNWFAIAWSPELELFAAVSSNGVNAIMTSPDGENWTTQPAPVPGVWVGIAWSPELGLFAAVSQDSGSASKIITSSDGITWNTTANSFNQWRTIVWSPERAIFVVGGFNASYAGYSSDGINWITTSPIAPIQSLTWSSNDGLFVGLTMSTSAWKVVWSVDGISWAATAGLSDQVWRTVTYSPELGLYVAVAVNGAQRVMTGIAVY